MSKPPSRPAPGYRTALMAQAAGIVRSIALERDPNRRARLCSHALLLISDADKAIGEVAGILHTSQKYDELLGLLAESGISLIADPGKALEVPSDMV